MKRVAVQAHGKVFGSRPRGFYRGLREMGWGRQEANLVAYGYALALGEETDLEVVL